MMALGDMVVFYEHDLTKMQKLIGLKNMTILDFPTDIAEKASIVVFINEKQIKVLKDRYNAITNTSGRLMKIRFVEEYIKRMYVHIGELEEIVVE